MTSRTFKATVWCSAEDLIEQLGDDRAFPACAPDILSVEDIGGGLRQWVLAFRGGTAEWVQHSRDLVGAQPYRIEFEQVTGDFHDFRGSWTTEDLAEGCEVTYQVDYSTSVPHLAGAIDTAIGRVLLRSVRRILDGICGPIHVTAGGEYLWDVPEATGVHGVPGSSDVPGSSGISGTERTLSDAIR
ncbi:type II toxin-antitoxin system RatA family toxin [Streptosporangium vulgare]|uniref:Type II toxin-antitoxin system RatA family toxin n=1 Tax=Streptosporangium vulgare TaxID=46190 RepID=A0ABV5T9Z2_9ACTN